jgi:hypothetical protein
MNLGEIKRTKIAFETGPIIKKADGRERHGQYTLTTLWGPQSVFIPSLPPILQHQSGIMAGT